MQSPFCFGIIMINKEDKISLCRIFYPVKVLGPGNRVGIWMNGCDKSCDDCVSPEMQYYDTSKEISIEKLISYIRSIKYSIDGFTISGGEPFYNPVALNALVQALAEISDDILIFSGYTIKELQDKNDMSIDNILGTCSVLIDGPYIKELNDNKALRGSSNQRMHIFKNWDKYADIEKEERKLQNIIYGNKLLTIGIPQGDLHND